MYHIELPSEVDEELDSEDPKQIRQACIQLIAHEGVKENHSAIKNVTKSTNVFFKYHFQSATDVPNTLIPVSQPSQGALGAQKPIFSSSKEKVRHTYIRMVSSEPTEREESPTVIYKSRYSIKAMPSYELD